jgi:hypothetical protein
MADKTCNTDAGEERGIFGRNTRSKEYQISKMDEDLQAIRPKDGRTN